MVNKNKGFTLTEVIVSMLILVILFLGVFTAFTALQNVNLTANKTQKEIDLGSSILEGMYDVSYDKLANETQTVNFLTTSFIPSNFDYTEAEQTRTILADSSIQYNLTNIKGSVSDYDVQVNISPITSVNSKGFSDFTTTSHNNTTILNVNTQDNTDSSYDTVAVNEFLARNKAYIDAKYNEAHNEYERVKYIHDNINSSIVVGEEPVLGTVPYVYQDINTITNNTTENIKIHVYKDTNNSYYSFEIQYTIPEDLAVEWFGDVVQGEQDITINKDTSVPELLNLILLFPKTICKEETIEVINGKDTVDSLCSLNFYFIYTTNASEYVNEVGHQYDVSNLTFKYKNGESLNLAFPVNQENTPKIYTNVSQIYNAFNMYSMGKYAQIFELAKAYNRMYNVNVHVLEKTSNTFTELSDSIIVLEQTKTDEE